MDCCAGRGLMEGGERTLEVVVLRTWELDIDCCAALQEDCGKIVSPIVFCNAWCIGHLGWSSGGISGDFLATTWDLGGCDGLGRGIWGIEGCDVIICDDSDAFNVGEGNGPYLFETLPDSVGDLGDSVDSILDFDMFTFPWISLNARLLRKLILSTCVAWFKQTNI